MEFGTLQRHTRHRWQEESVMKKVIVVTGSSSGFGALAARALAKAGHIVYASMRDTSGRNKGQVQEAAKFAADNKADLRTVELDVLSDTSANAAVKRIIDDNGRLDVVVHNAGHMVFGPLEAFTPEQLGWWYSSLPRPLFCSEGRDGRAGCGVRA